MTSKPRQRGGQAKAEEKAVEEQQPLDHGQEAQVADADRTSKDEPGKADETAKAGEDNPGGDPAAGEPREQPEQQATDGGNAAGEGATTGQQAAFGPTFHQDGEPQPAQVEQGMARAETGLSQEAYAGGDVPTAAFGDDERNGKAMGIPTDTTGELRRREDAIPTAAHGRTERNGLAAEMIEGQTSREFGDNGDSVAKLQNGGVRAEVGAGTGTPAPVDERPTYPSTLLTRSSPNAAPSEPDDVKLATQPRLGDPKTSTDPVMTSSAMPSMPGDRTEKLVDSATGEEVKPSAFFEVPDGPQARSFRVVKHRVSRIFTVREVKTPSRQLLFTEGQLVPVEQAETLIALHG